MKSAVANYTLPAGTAWTRRRFNAQAWLAFKVQSINLDAGLKLNPKIRTRDWTKIVQYRNGRQRLSQDDPQWSRP